MRKIKRSGDSMLRDSLAIFAITIVAGLILGGVFKLTTEPIQKAAQDAKNKSYQMVMEASTDFSKDEQLTKKMEEFQPKGCEINEVVVAKDKDGKQTGYAVLVSSKEGYGGDIRLSIGVSLDGTIQGIQILEMSETAGLGAKCAEDEFKDQYKGISEEVTLVKGVKSADNEISAISGATITSKAITNAVNEVLSFLKEVQ